MMDLKNTVTDILQRDPVKYCLVYKLYGCTYVGGRNCNVDTCSILRTCRVLPDPPIYAEPVTEITDADRYAWLRKNRGYSNTDIDNMIHSQQKHNI